MKVINLGLKNSVLNKFVSEMRDKDIQKDSLRFRRNLERLGEIFAYEIILNFFDDAQNAFVAAYRKYDKGEDFHINIEYASTPDLNGKTLILADTMLATGASLEIAYNRLCEEGEPAHTHLVCPIASAYAVEYLQKHIPADKATLWVAAIDEELTSHSYIVPGIGDAGDLAYGVKK